MDPCFEPSRVVHMRGLPARVRIVLRDIDFGSNAGWETEILLDGIVYPAPPNGRFLRDLDIPPPPPPGGRVVRTPGFWATLGRAFREMFG